MRGSLHCGRDDGFVYQVRWIAEVEEVAEAGAVGGEGVVEAEEGRGDLDGAGAGEADDADAAAAGWGGDGDDGVGVEHA
jgi:hypothetical protein